MPPVPYSPHRSARFAHSALKESVCAQDRAQQCAVLWFGEIMRRKLYRELGYSSINQYAREALGFSKTRTGDHIKLAGRLDKLPVLRKSVARGDVGYTKAREVVKVADPENEKAWVEVARNSSRRELESKVARAKRREAEVPGQPALMPEVEPLLPKASPPVRVNLDMTPEQFSRFEKLMEGLAKGGCIGDRADVVLEALAALAGKSEKAPRGAREGGAPFQVHVHECPTCQAATVATAKGDLTVDSATVERARCDGRVDAPGRRNTATIPINRTI